MASQILTTLLEDIKTAMKSQDKEKVLALRTLHSEIKNYELHERKEADDGDIAVIVTKAIKQRTESIEQFGKGGRQDLVAREQAQIEMYKKYLPQQMSAEEIAQLVDKAIAEIGAVGKKDFGKVMKVVMPLVKGRADGKLVHDIVTSKLP